MPGRGRLLAVGQGIGRDPPFRLSLASRQARIVGSVLSHTAVTTRNPTTPARHTTRKTSRDLLALAQSPCNHRPGSVIQGQKALRPPAPPRFHLRHRPPARRLPACDAIAAIRRCTASARIPPVPRSSAGTRRSVGPSAAARALALRPSLAITGRREVAAAGQLSRHTVTRSYAPRISTVPCCSSHRPAVDRQLSSSGDISGRPRRNLGHGWGHKWLPTGSIYWRPSIGAFFNRRRLRKHKTIGYLTSSQTTQRHQHALAAQRSYIQDHWETPAVAVHGQVELQMRGAPLCRS